MQQTFVGSVSATLLTHICDKMDLSLMQTPSDVIVLISETQSNMVRGQGRGLAASTVVRASILVLVCRPEFVKAGLYDSREDQRTITELNGSNFDSVVWVQ
jgi:hypothetical protein